MNKPWKFGKDSDKKRMENQEKSRMPKNQPLGGRDILRREAQFRIAPKHPGMGRR